MITLDAATRDTFVEFLKNDGDVFTDDLACAFSGGNANLVQRCLDGLATRVRMLDSLGWADHADRETYTLEVDESLHRWGEYMMESYDGCWEDFLPIRLIIGTAR